ncbi:MAG: hypothetical protein IKW33_02510 [Clostridia bacterium]|nr:hypothetical protein [Clostridia bacterium]
MTPFEIYSLVICIIVYVLLASVGIFMITVVFKLSLKLIRCGGEDQEILKEHEKLKGKKKNCALDCISSIFLCSILVLIFGFSTYVGCTSNSYLDNAPTFKVVNSSSMATKNEKNEYLFKNNLNNQFSTFDLILTYKIPKEEDIKLYDIVIYEIDGYLIIHRVVGIEEKNERHPTERWFLLQGDAISQADRFPVKYSQMRGIYKDEKIPFIGSFVSFMQSPAGYMCIILVGLAIIFTPIFEKKLEKEKALRLAILLPATEIAVSKDEKQKTSKFSHLKDKINSKTFAEKLEELPIARERYLSINSLLNRVSGVRTIESKKARTFKAGNESIVKFAVKGKTLNAYISLDPVEYENTKYVFLDVKDVKKFANYPMRVKVTSERQLHWVKELLIEKVNKSGLTLLEEEIIIPIETEAETFNFSHLKDKINSKTFAEKLEELPIARERYLSINSLLNRVSGVRIIESKKARTFKAGNEGIVKFAVKGKTLNAYVALEPKEYEDSKYIFLDESSVKKHANYPMRVKVTSGRQLRWVKELLIEKVNKSGLTLLEEEKIIDTSSAFSHLKNKKASKSFKQKLKLYKTAKERYNEIKKQLEIIPNVRVIEGKQAVTYKVKNNGIVKFSIKGKTLNAYLNLNPIEYENTKYIFKNVANVKKYSNYPMRVKITSNRQVKWVKELISQILEKGNK